MLEPLTRQRFRRIILIVAQRTSPGKKKPASKTSAGCLLWIAFAILIIVLFLFNREAIQRTLEVTQFRELVMKRPSAEAPAEQRPVDPALDTPVSPAPSDPGPSDPPTTPPTVTVAPIPVAPAVDPTTPQGTQPQRVPAARPIPPPAVSAPAATPRKPAVELRNRNIYFIRIDADGTISRAAVVRSLPVSDSPMTDAVTALLAGPTAAEEKMGYTSLIPEGTRLLSALRRGKTAYLSFNEDFQFSTFGAPGYLAQLQQVLWTATEFPGVEDVQILIEGKVVDFLGAEVPMGAPLKRSTFH